MPNPGSGNTALVTGNRLNTRQTGNSGKTTQTQPSARNVSTNATTDRTNSRHQSPAQRETTPNPTGDQTEIMDAKTAVALLCKEGIISTGDTPDLFALGEALFGVVRQGNQTSGGTGMVKAVALILQNMTIAEGNNGTTGGERTTTREEMNKLVGGVVEAMKVDWEDMCEKMMKRVDEVLEARGKKIEDGVREMLQTHGKEEREARSELLNKLPKTFAKVVGETGGEGVGGKGGGGVSTRGVGGERREGQTGGLNKASKFAKRQVMIEKATGFSTWNLYELDDAAIIAKVNIALNNVRKELRPNAPITRFEAVRKMPRGGVLLTADSEETAEWVKGGGRTRFLENLGCTTMIAEKGYRVAVDYVPVYMKPEDVEERRRLEERNKFATGSIIDARWMKHPSRRRPGQQVATMQVTMRRARQANQIINVGLKFDNKIGEGRRMEVIPCVCYNCQEVDAKHIATNCPNETVCLGCGGPHNHRNCDNYDQQSYYCKNCDLTGDHGPGSKDCPKYQEARMRIEARVPGNGDELYEETDCEEEGAREDEGRRLGGDEGDDENDERQMGDNEGVNDEEMGGQEADYETEIQFTMTPVDKQWKKKEKKRLKKERRKARAAAAAGTILTDWEAFRVELKGRLEALPRPREFRRGELDACIQARVTLETAISDTIEKVVPKSKAVPWKKRWWTRELGELQREAKRAGRRMTRARKKGRGEERIGELERKFRRARNRYTQAIKEEKQRHWEEWLEELDDKEVWIAGKMVGSGGSDGGRTRVPTLRKEDGEEAATNEEKGKMFFEAFFPKRTAPPAHDVATHRREKWKYVPTTDEEIDEVIRSLKPYKKSRQDTAPNCVFVKTRELIVPYLGPIFRATDTLDFYPADWKVTETPILRKPGRGDYTVPGAYRPILVDFSRKKATNDEGHKVDLPRPELKLRSLTIKPSKHAKFLGLILDQELRWKEQNTRVVTKAAYWSAQLQRLAKNKTGVNHKNLRRLFISTALPRITYGIEVFNPPRRGRARTFKSALEKKLDSIIGRIAVAIVGGLRTSPRDVAMAHANLDPAKIVIERVYAKAAVRLATIPKTHPLHAHVSRVSKRGTKRFPSPLHLLMQYFDISVSAMEKIKPHAKLTWDPDKVVVEIMGEREEAVERERGRRSQRQDLYTDGSLTEWGVAGAAVWMKRDREQGRRAVRLGDPEENTVYEAELMGLVLGMEMAIEKKFKGAVHIGLDNQAVLATIRSRKPRFAQHIWTRFEKLVKSYLKKDRSNMVILRWVPGHEGVEGNEKADEAAKVATENRRGEGEEEEVETAESGEEEEEVPISKAATRQRLMKGITEKRKEEWRDSKRYEKIKRFDPTLPSKTFSKLTNHMQRKQASILFQLRTGHVQLKKYLHMIGKADSPVCEGCGRRNETVYHFLMEC
ncbi:hypothetical protein CVT24_002565, partial [Panaeolus cyanescens]